MLTLAALGVSETGLSLMAHRYQRAIAQPTSRKLALLVGINQYPEQVCDCVPVRGTALNGCLTDVELQRELLIHRFGFQPADILTLTNQKATRQGIETAFLSHLTEQARPDDVVLFHFSGFGSRIKLDGGLGAMQSSLVPVDGFVPTEEEPAIQDVLLETLVLLLRSLQTSQVTTVLDTSYTDPGKALQGNLRIRSRPHAPLGQVHAAELGLQEQLLSQLNLSREQIQTQLRSRQLPGLVLAAAGGEQVATEGQWNGFSAGLFTYALTQQLWSATPTTTLQVNLSRASATVAQVAGESQKPQLSGQKVQDVGLTAYRLPPVPTGGADGVITGIEEDGRTARIWMGGLPTVVLEHYGSSGLLDIDRGSLSEASMEARPVQQPPVDSSVAPSVESVAPSTEPSTQPSVDQAAAGKAGSSPERQPLLQMRSREGLTVRARLSSPSVPLQVGQLIHERVRILPRNIGLTVALDASLERIERVDATSAFSGIPRVSSVVAGEQPADCVFGKIRPMPRMLASSLSVDALSAEAIATPTPSRDLSPVRSGYGLFSVGRTAIPNTLAEEEEAVKTAVSRVTPQLRTLLALKLLRLTTNSNSSQLGVQMTLEMMAPQERILLQQQTVRAPWTVPQGRLASLFSNGGELPALPAGSQIQYRLNNYSDRPVYFILLGIDSSGSAIALYPTPETAANDAEPKPAPRDSIVPAGETLIIPQPNASSEWVMQGPAGLAETHLICSRTPLTKTFAMLEVAMRSMNNARRVNVLSQPLEVAQAVLQDLHQGSEGAIAKADVPADTYALDVRSWATFSLVYRVV